MKDDELVKYYYENFDVSYFYKLNVVVYLVLYWFDIDLLVLFFKI